MTEKSQRCYHDVLQIGNNVIQCIDFVMCPSEVIEFCRMSNFGQKSGRVLGLGLELVLGLCLCDHSYSLD